MKTYLEALQKGGISPNFWCSTEYAEKAGWKEEIKAVKASPSDRIFVFDSDDELMLPPILPEYGAFSAPYGFGDVWSDIPDFPGYNGHHKEFLDYEYIFDPSRFENMEGGSWSVFRKNSRKWPNRIDHEWMYLPLDKNHPQHHLEGLLLDWLEAMGTDSIIHDHSVLYRYLLEGKNRKGLFTADGQLHALNIWDDNWKYINYRYCICRPESFLSEFARLLFYQDMNKTFPGKLVNDGGCLDRISLKEFKDRMQPVSVRKVYSWKAK